MSFIRSLQNLPPAYFAMVMATGIISSTAQLLGKHTLAMVLFVLNVVCYLALCVLNVARTTLYPRRVLNDLFDHKRGVEFFTVVVATCVIGSKAITILEAWRLAVIFWIAGIVSWVLLSYTIFASLTVKASKPPLSDGISGAWLLDVVATQSVALLSAQISEYLGPYKLVVDFLALSLWLWGGMLYIWMISLIFYRYTFFRLSPSDLSPPYWINMGAMAISALTGAQLISNSSNSPFLFSSLPFLQGFTVFYWATGTWWLPMLIVLGVWRHVLKRFPLRYDVQYWGAVFPLGMYSACTLAIAHSMHLPFLEPLSKCFFWLACIAWSVTFTGFLKAFYHEVSSWFVASQNP